MDKNIRIAIIGGGPAGLSAGMYLEQKGYENYTIFERLDRVGGKCWSPHYNGRRYEMGAIMGVPSYYAVEDVEKFCGITHDGPKLNRNYKDGSVLAVNETIPEAVVEATLKVYDIHSKLVREEKKEITSRAYEPVKVFEKIAGPCFVSLEIDGPFKARNFYAIPAGNNVYSGKDEWWGVETDKYADLRFVSELPEALVRMDIRKTGDSYEITLENVSEVIAYQNILTKDGVLYILQDQQLLRSVDGSNWETVGTTGLSRLVAAGTKKLYGISTSGVLMASADQGVTWTEEKMDTPSEWLPDGDISYAVLPLHTNKDIERLVIAGNRSAEAYPNDGYAVVWGKVEDLSGDAEDNSWMFYTQTTDNIYSLPRLSNVTICKYGDVLLAFGGNGIGACTESAFSKIYVSLDGGISWKGSKTYPVPEGMAGSNQAFTSTVDANNCLWIIFGDGQVWRGRLNRLGWANIQK